MSADTFPSLASDAPADPRSAASAGPGRRGAPSRVPERARQVPHADFRRTCEQIAGLFNRQGQDYLGKHLRRFYDTYSFILRHYGVPARVASLGAGSAYVEAALAGEHGVQVTVYDLPDALVEHQGLYQRLGFAAEPVDLSRPLAQAAAARDVDLILCAEIVEHLPVAPSVQFAETFARVGAEAPIVVTTPNGGSLRNLLKLLFMQPVLPPAELGFAPSSYETEGVHRREYLPCEIREAFRAVGHDLKALELSWYHRPLGPAEAVIYPWEALVPRFRPCMLAGSVRAA